MKIVVLGGAGKMGCISTQCLAGDSRVDEVVIADLNEENARIVAAYLKSGKVRFAPTNLRNPEELDAVLEGADVCLNATTYYTNVSVMQSCMRTKTHYTDMGGLFHVTRKQLELSAGFAEAGIGAVLGMGSAPGIPNVQTRYAADRLDTLQRIRIYDGIKPPPADDLRFTYAIPTILDEISLQPMVFEKGKFVAKQPLTGFEDYWFTPPIGLLPMHYSLHSEVATLPVSFRKKGVVECFFKINYWGMAKETVEKVLVLAQFGFQDEEPIEIDGQLIKPKRVMEALLSRRVPAIEEYLAPAKMHPPHWTKEIVTEIHGEKGGQAVVYRMGTLTCKGALPTGLAPAIAAIWLGEGRIQPGVHPPETVLPPEEFFAELEPYEVVTKATVTSPI
jgi:saccharopine dehydrogenase-like NADP-dependent oxidoreductase